jgi:hypothetical protein
MRDISSPPDGFTSRANGRRMLAMRANSFSGRSRLHHRIGDVHAATGRAFEALDDLVAAPAEQGARAKADRDDGDHAADGGDQHRRADAGDQIH